jgi:hypothetical protein
VTDPTQLGPEAPVEDVLEQLREEVEPDDETVEPIAEPPEEASEADYVEQHIVVPVDDDGYPGGPG